MIIDDENLEILQEFLIEALDVISRIQAELSSYGNSEAIEDQFNEIARGLHTIKGGASMFQMTEITQKAHKLETFLLQFKAYPHKLSGKHLTSVSRYIDNIQTLLEASDPTRQSQPEPSPNPGSSSFTETSEVSQKADRNSGENTKKRNSHLDVIRIPIDRIEKSIDNITEIFLLRNQMSHLVNTLLRNGDSVEDFLVEWEGLDNSMRKSIGELEHNAMSMRMMPLKSLFQRMEKTVRTYLESSSKDIKIHLNGEDTEIDKKILDYLGEPLIHLIRNAMDHGIETPEVRQSHGKKSQGNIYLSAEVRGNEVQVKIADDGKGIDHQAVLASAQKKGLDTSHVQNKEQALDLIFMPGFSTAEQVSEVSGRGVGMDAVRNFVEGIGGSIHLSTEIGNGSSFVLTLPLGMSLIPAILARINEQIYAISSNDVLETVRYPRDQVCQNGVQQYLSYKGEMIPCYFLDQHIALSTKRHALEVVDARISICIIKTNEEYAALVVNDFLTNTEIATKPLPNFAPKISYVTGASILATGEPVLVLSMRRLHQWLKQRQNNVGMRHAA